jgi:hypothetical protein
MFACVRVIEHGELRPTLSWCSRCLVDGGLFSESEAMEGSLLSFAYASTLQLFRQLWSLWRASKERDCLPSPPLKTSFHQTSSLPHPTAMLGLA